MTLTDSFQPPWVLKGAFLQTVLASNRLRTLGENPIKSNAKPQIITTSAGVKLSASFSIPLRSPLKGMVIILHGWEGSIDSTYVLRTGKYLYHNGYAICRINLRDHGQTHHLNKGIFLATLLDEVFEVVSKTAHKIKHIPAFLVGFSLGGNFALRIAKRSVHCPIAPLKCVVAVSPVLDPQKATDCIDNHKILRYYFLKKWIRSLKLKQSCFPAKYDFAHILNLGTVKAITEELIPRYTDMKNASEYFKGYTLSRNDLFDVPMPVTIITAKDDPVIPVADFRNLRLNNQTRLIIHPHGGHNGFIDTILLSSWYEHKLVELFNQLTA